MSDERRSFLKQENEQQLTDLSMWRTSRNRFDSGGMVTEGGVGRFPIDPQISSSSENYALQSRGKSKKSKAEAKPVQSPSRCCDEM